MYINCHSYYSLKYGTLSPKELVAEAVRRGVKTLALTDINNTSCAFDFITACKKEGIKPVVGIEFRTDRDAKHSQELDDQTANKTEKQNNEPEVNYAQFLYLGIAKNGEGFREVNEWLTQHSLAGSSLPEIAPPFKNVYVIYRKLVKPIEDFRENEFIGIRPHEVNKLFRSPISNHLDKLVIFSPVSFLDDDGMRTHQLLRCIDLNIVLGKLDPIHCANKNEYFYPPDTLKKFFERYPEIIINTENLLDSCEIDMKPTHLLNRRCFSASEEDDFKLLTKLTMDGCRTRFGEKNSKALKRTTKELKVIRKMGFSSYFLITWDIVRYARLRGFHHVGRGSGANSIVAYCLYITDVNPLELDLYFERFINPHRSSPPDFDVDFSWDERDDIIDYIFKRYGKEHTAMIATYNTFKGKSIIRELGKVFGLPKDDIDCIVNEPLSSHKHHHFSKHIFKYGKRIEGFPNYLSIHAGGILISEDPLNYHTALQMMPKGFPITHFDMYGAEDLGFHKYDILSQRGLGHIKDAVTYIQENKGVHVDIHAVEAIKQNEKVRTQLHSGQCIGCFYIESPAMRGLLTKLKCDNYIHLVAASSIIRPGVAKSGMMREYIHRFHHPDSYDYIHPVFEQHLGETYGVMVYQEDVMKIVHHFAGLDLDESDVLRRIMTGKKKSSDTFARLREKYFRNCKTRGYTEELTQEVWRQIESFSGYSFCKAHSASFAVESFQSLYLKAYHPLEFMVAVINNFGGFYNTELYVHEARMQGGKIHAPCVNKSLNLTCIDGKDIYLGFIHVHSLERKIARTIVAERTQNGVYLNLEQFVARVAISKDQLELLIRIGAFRFTGMNKYELMWEKNSVHNPAIKKSHTVSMFTDESHEHFKLPILEESRHDQAFDEIELLGFPLCSPFELLKTHFRGDIMTLDMVKHMGKQVRMVGYYVARKNVTTVNKRLMNFGTWVDMEGRFFDTTHFPPSLEKYPFKGKGCYLIQGKIVEDFGFPSMEVDKMAMLPFVADGRY